MYKYWILALTLAGCGVETVGTAALEVAQKKQEIEQGQRLKQSVQQQLDAATQQQRLEASEAGTK